MDKPMQLCFIGSFHVVYTMAKQALDESEHGKYCKIGKFFGENNTRKHFLQYKQQKI